MDHRHASPERVRLMGGGVDVITAADILRFTADRIGWGRKGIVANHNAHSLALMRRDRSMRNFYAMADLIEIDSMPLIAWGKLLGLPIDWRHRATYLDWREDFWRMAQAGGWRVFYLGGERGVAARAAAKLAARYPGVTLAVHHGYFDQNAGSAENLAVIETINAFTPDVVFVGLGMPLQERWIAANYRRVGRGVVFSVGGAFDYEAGIQSVPPRWTGRAGVEWLFRFAGSPRRLFARYFIEPWALLRPALADLRAAWRRDDARTPRLVGAKLETLEYD